MRYENMAIHRMDPRKVLTKNFLASLFESLKRKRNKLQRPSWALALLREPQEICMSDRDV